MRKIVVVLAVAAAALVSVAPQAHAADTYPNVSSLTPFSPEANFMSLPGYLRLRVLTDQGRWITRQEAVDAVTSQGAPTGPAAR